MLRRVAGASSTGSKGSPWRRERLGAPIPRRRPRRRRRLDRLPRRRPGTIEHRVVLRRARRRRAARAASATRWSSSAPPRPRSTTSTRRRLPDGQMAGAEVQANAIATVLRRLRRCGRRRARRPSLIVLLALVAPLRRARCGRGSALAAALGAGVLYAVAAALFDAGGSSPVVAPLAACASASSPRWPSTGPGRPSARRTRDAFARFVPAAVVDEVLARDRARATCGSAASGWTRPCCSATCAASPLRRALDAEQVIDVLDRYLTEMSDAILDHGGTLVAYMGDGIMAVFGAPDRSRRPRRPGAAPPRARWSARGWRRSTRGCASGLADGSAWASA